MTFVRDEGFRKGLRDLVKKLDDDFSPLLPKKSERVARETYKVVYGIMRKPYADGSLDVPFFSKLSFQAAAMRIGEIGIPIAIELIEKPAADKTD